jgi:hypothetical protein
MMFVNQERKPLFVMPLELFGVMAGWGLVFVVLIASLHFISAQPVSPSVVAEDPLKAQIEKLRERQQKLGVLISEIETERSAIVGRIRLGNAQAIHAHELLEIDRSLKQLKEQADETALTITTGEVLLRQRRLRDAAVDSNELAELSVEIEEKLSEPQSVGEVIQLDRVIRDAVGKNR